MSQNICEYLREKVINDLFGMDSFKRAWVTWKPHIQSLITPLNARNVLDLGDELSNIFKLTSSSGRSQSSVSSAGAVWEALVCWYLNICLIESRTVVIKHSKELIPLPVQEAITVSYGTFPSNTESDLIAITFPDEPEYKIDKFSIIINDSYGKRIDTKKRNGAFNYNCIVDALVDRDFEKIEIGIIQCKTNWNDTAQIPMLWDMIYSSLGFKHLISVGRSGYSIKDISKFTYSFVTVPTNDKKSKFEMDSTHVRRVANLTGGNYWGKPTKPSVANSIKEIFNKNFSTSSTKGFFSRLNSALSKLHTTYSYFDI
jgi:hypothetical protein